MSRVIVKGLPRYFTEDKLKKLFEEEGSVTDVKVIRKRNGESRRFAFIGFKSNEDAENAVKHYNGTFVDTSKIDVQIAKTFSEAPMSYREKMRLQEQKNEKLEERLNHMRALEKSVRLRKKEEEQSKKAKEEGTTVEDKIKNNPQLQEYMQTMKTDGRSWNNDEVVNDEGAPSSEGLAKALAPPEQTTVAEEGESDDEYEEFNQQGNEADKDSLDGEEEESEHEEMMPLSEVNDDATNTTEESKPEEMDDSEWLRSRRVRIPERGHRPDSDEEEEETKEEKSEEASGEVSEQHEEVEAPKKKRAPRKSAQEISAEQIADTGRLFLRNILYSSTEKDFNDLFSRFGELEEVHVAVDTRTGNSKGFAYVQFKDPQDAVGAFQTLDKSIFQGRLLHILPGKPKKENKLDEFALKNMPLKKQRHLKRKLNAAKHDFSWNSLYMNNDAVLESVANDMGISKSELIDPENSSSAVKQALAEAHVIGDVRKYFEEKGVDLTKFDQNERDDKTILVKNFSHGTTKEDIGEKFAQYGQLKRILMPPAGTIAIVEFRDAPAGRTAFNNLAFKRMGTSILYLEKGPKDLFTSEPTDEDVVDNTDETTPANVAVARATTEDLHADEEKEDEEADDEEPAGPTTSIFVKNLNFSTTSSDLTSAFKPLDGFVLAVVKTKPDTKHPGKTLSMGFGFVEFKTRPEALAAIRAMDGYILDGHKLQLKLSTRGGSADGEQKKRKRSKKSSKIIVKNLPFEATRKDLFELFNSFGSLKSVRVPKKFDRSARGFGFVEFMTTKEAESVMDQLQGVHLLGRRLVLDFAEKDADDAEEEIERLTKKAKKQTNARKLADIRESNTASHKLDMDELEE